MKTKVTIDDIAKAIEKLEKKGKNVTAKSVHQLLNKGGYSTVSKLMAQYKNKSATSVKKTSKKTKTKAIIKTSDYDKGYNKGFKEALKQVRFAIKEIQ